MKYFKVFNTENEYLEYIHSEGCITPYVITLRDSSNTWIRAEVHDYSKDYFTIESLGDGVITFTIKAPVGTSALSYVAYSTNSGDSWTTVQNVDNEEKVASVNVSSGDTVLWKGEGLRTAVHYTSSDFTIESASTFTSTCNFNVGGNIMSLLFGDDFANVTVLNNDNNTSVSNASAFRAIFSGNTNIINAKDLVLPATNIARYCYRDMFNRCENLITPPSISPVDTACTCSYRAMFSHCSSLTTTPQLIATTLQGDCYYAMFDYCTSLTNISLTIGNSNSTMTSSGSCKNMFNSCTNLTTVPRNMLSATALTTGCYQGMFYGCTSLTTAPELPATTLAQYCYDEMFRGCTSLTTAPELPANTMANYCYREMFHGCSSLTTAPSILSATTMATECCKAMFANCTSLTTTPELPATALANSCYANMFSACTSITDMPILSADTIPTSGYQAMFAECTSLTGVTKLSATTVGDYCYGGMFRDCTSLTTVPQDMLPALTVNEMSYNQMFRGCTSLTATPSLPATTIASRCYKEMFSGCTALASTVNALPATTLASECYRSMFTNCTSLTTAPELPATTLASECYRAMFSHCTSLVTGPSSIGSSSTTIPNSGCAYMFEDTALVSTPELPATTLEQYCYYSMFYNCTSLTTAPELPATTLANSCYGYMFYGCTSLTTAPELPATTLMTKCYGHMFHDCTKLNYIKCLATDISADNCTSEWTRGVASNGTFVKASTMEDWTRGWHGIPPGWTVHNDTYVEVTGVTISASAATVNKGNTYTLTANVLPSNAYDQVVSWSTSDSSVATVSNGVVTGVGCGDATITVTTDEKGYTATCDISVENHVTSVDINPYIVTIVSGNTYQLETTILPSDACDKSVTWSSSNENVATVDSNGLVSGVTTGSATVTVTTRDGGFTKNCGITVNEGQHVTGVTLSDAEITVNKDDTYTLTATVTPNDAADKSVAWSSSDNTIATVDSNGVVSGVTTGSATVTVTTVDGGFTAQCSVTVEHTRDYSLEYFTIESLVDNNEVKIWRGQNSAPTNFDIEYSLDGTNWISTNSATTSVTITNSGDTMLLRASANKWANSYSAHTSIACSGNYVVYGNIMSLLYGESYSNKVSLTNDFALAGVFWANMSRSGSDTGTATTNTTLISAENLILPATTLRSNCYNGMFRGCVGLEYPPKELPAPVVTTAAYSSMFDECYNLRIIPNIKATSVTDKENFRRMFRVQNTSVNPRLTEVHLPHIETLVTQSFQELFKGQKNLSYIECTVTGKTATNCLDNWVNGVAESGVFVKDANTSWNTGVSGIPNGWITNDYVADVFYMIANTNSVVSFSNTIYYGYGEKQIWTQLAANTNLNIQSGEKVIFKATLTPSSSDGVGQFSISGDVSIGGNPMSLITNQTSRDLTVYDYAFKGLFSGCTGITDASALTMHDTLSTECYNRMFYGCTSLTRAPKLPAGTLVADCYKEMFSGCTSLNHIEALFLTEPSTAYTSNWVNGVAATGTFKVDVYVQWDTETNRGVNGIPQGWTVRRSYVELEYIESTSGDSGGQYIDLDINLYEELDNWYDIAIKFTFLGNGKGNETQSTMFGCQENVNPWTGTFIRRNNNNVQGRYIGGTNKDNTIGTVGVDVPIELPVQTAPDRNVTSLNNPNNTTHSWGTSLFCFFSDANNTPARFCRGKLYYFKLFLKASETSQGTLVRDMIPCKTSSGIVGLFDKVNNKLYTSPNGVAFEAGPEINS